MTRSIKIGLLFIFMPALVLADTSSLHQLGVEAFRSGQYEQALEYFQQLEARGVQTATLYYNLGSTYYKLGKYQHAEKAFTRLSDFRDWEPLALYNLGLTAEATEDPDAAEAYYSGAFQKAGDQSRVKRLAGLKLESLRETIEDFAPARGWRGFITAAAGYDDNPALVPDNVFDDIRDSGDLFAELSAFGGGYLSGDYHRGLYLQGAGYARLYAEAHEYDFTSLYAGLSRHRQYEKWHTRVGLAVNAGIIHDSYYATTPSVALTARRYFEVYEIKLDNETSWIGARDPYEHLTGIRNLFTAELIRRMNRADIFAGYRFEYNDRDDWRDNGAFFSYSPLRNTVYAKADWFVGTQWTLTIGGEYRKSVYADAHKWSVNGSEVRKRRDDERLAATIRGEREIPRDAEVFAEYRYTDNDSNLSSYTYRSNQIMLGIRKFF